ncbi:nucleotidyltransferase domain-containing protein [Desulforamulus aeronauticus]|uniref:Nucleotidyltransferase domain-containing protein n=1 Tax=Desulforamulus aeronauticus DSM 10349 TaxID=1121421 RepID=A0A1M6SSW8_9FIRM|nr:nucleotidyltransferase domain-containing protein [Desulforamulus aeronauticus]SHK47678.1 Nucleotidyltransferase domain-containing protein [Desulforamulus aeronauticus DSM 10349]
MNQLPVDISQALDDFCQELRQKLPNDIVEIRLFGSMAKGLAVTDSDIDVLIVLKNKSELVKELILETQVDINLKYDVFISIILKSQIEFSYPAFRQSLFFRNLQEEGIML